MKHPFTPRILSVAIVGVVMLGQISASAAETFNPKVGVAKSVKELKFEEITPTIKFAKAYGDYNSTANGRFATFAGKWTSPSHIHSAAYHGVVIKGVVTNGFSGDKNPLKMEAGSYWYVPASAIHTTACVSKEPCLVYIHMDDKFDFIPKEE